MVTCLNPTSVGLRNFDGMYQIFLCILSIFTFKDEYPGWEK